MTNQSRVCKDRVVCVGDQKMTLYDWAKKNGTSPETANKRWRRGERDPFKLIGKNQAKKKATTKAMIPVDISWQTLEYLEQTAWCRKGMPDEWEIACDLAGIPRYHAGYLQWLMEAAT